MVTLKPSIRCDISSKMDNDPPILASLYASSQYPPRSNSIYSALDQIPTNRRPNLHRKSNSACSRHFITSWHFI